MFHEVPFRVDEEVSGFQDVSSEKHRVEKCAAICKVHPAFDLFTPETNIHHHYGPLVKPLCPFAFDVRLLYDITLQRATVAFIICDAKHNPFGIAQLFGLLDFQDVRMHR